MRAAVLTLLIFTACGRSELYRYAPDAAVLPQDCELQCPLHAHEVAGCACVCDDGYLGDGGTCVSIAASLEGQRWELPCVAPWPDGPEYVCISGPDTTSSVTLQGSPSLRYEVRLRVRGVVETKAYPGGIGDGGAVVLGGQPADDAWNVYRLDVSSPAQRWHLNHGPSGLYLCRTIDERFTVQAQGGAGFTLFASTVDGNRTEILNRDADGGALVVPGVRPAPAPFDGQFLQLDVEGVRTLP